MSSRYRIYPSKEATIASGSLYENLNSSQENACNIWYGGGVQTSLERRNSISRHLVYFNLSGISQQYASFTLNSAYTTSYILKYTNCIPSNKILEPEYEFDVLNKSIASSFDLVFFPINKAWDEGRGGALDNEKLITFKNFSPILSGVTNWLSATTLISWDVPGIVLNPTADTANYTTQHFELGAENINVNVTAMVNDWLSGGSVNNGIGIAYNRSLELLSTDTRYISSFHTNKSNSFFKPYIEVVFNNSAIIRDDRHWVTNNRRSRLYLYTFSGNQATNYFSANTVFIKNSANVIVHSNLVPVHQEKGVYYVDVFMSASTKGQKYRDVWSGLTFVPGYDQQDITQSFDIRDNFFGTTATKTNDYTVDIYGLNNNTPLATGEIHRIYADVRVGYSNARPSTDFGLEYRITMGLDEINPWCPMNSAIIDDSLTCFFDLDTSWLLNSQVYMIEFRISEFGTKRILPNKLTFSVMNTI